MISLKTVLVATDFSEPSDVALAYGRELARSYQGTLHVVNVVDDIRWRYSLDMTPVLLVGVQDSLDDAARQRLEALISDEDRDQLHAVARVETSSAAADAIVAYAEKSKADVIVIGTHGRGGLPRLFMGSVAERVVRLAPCPVLTVRSKERDFVAPDALAVTSQAGADAVNARAVTPTPSMA